MGSTPDALPHAGKVPGSKNQWILAGFNGIGMFQIFTMAQAVAKMVIRGHEYEDTGLLYMRLWRRLSALLLSFLWGFSEWFGHYVLLLE